MGLLGHLREDKAATIVGLKRLSLHSVAPWASFSERVQKKVDMDGCFERRLHFSHCHSFQIPRVECHTVWEMLLMGRWVARSQCSFKQNSSNSAQRQPGVGAGGGVLTGAWQSKLDCPLCRFGELQKHTGGRSD